MTTEVVLSSIYGGEKGAVLYPSAGGQSAFGPKEMGSPRQAQFSGMQGSI